MKPINMAGPWITDIEKRIVADMMENGWDNYDYVKSLNWRLLNGMEENIVS